ncbi:DUF362 domain-containing protein [bacterium]|nr:DUF362 domain-containing protein [bacterium]
MDNTVGVVRGTDKHLEFQKLLSITQFDAVLNAQFGTSGKTKDQFSVVIKPNMMVYINPKDHEVVVTDRALVEALVDHIRGQGFTKITVVEAQNDVGRMFKNHNVKFVAAQIGYSPDGRYTVRDLTEESVKTKYEYTDFSGRTKTWKHTVGKTWRDADFRISFAKCKTHEHDYMTLAVKNIYGCFPDPDKVCKYHIRYEVWDVTGRSYRNFPVHFAFVDGWVASDGFQGYKIPSPRHLKMLFGGRDAVAVDMEIFRRAGLDPMKSRILKRVVQQLNDGKTVYPEYKVAGDTGTKFQDLMPWKNVTDQIVDSIDILEEVYVAWGFINMKPAALYIDYTLFPPKNIFSRIGVWITKLLYNLFKGCKWYKKLYSRNRKGG